MCSYSDLTIDTVAALETDEDTIPLELIVALLESIDARDSECGAVLVFLPGWGDISKLNELLLRHHRVRPFPTHRCACGAHTACNRCIPHSFAAKTGFECCPCMAACQRQTSGPFSRRRHVACARLCWPQTLRRRGRLHVAGVLRGEHRVPSCLAHRLTVHPRPQYHN